MGRGYVHHFLYLEYFIAAAVEKLSGTFLVIISKVAMSFIHSIPPPNPEITRRWGKGPHLSEEPSKRRYPLGLRKRDTGVYSVWRSQKSLYIRRQIQEHCRKDSKYPKEKCV